VLRNGAIETRADEATILAQRLRQRLAQKNKSYRACAKESGLSLSTIAKLASGKKALKPSLSTISAIAAVLETTPEWLTGRGSTTLIALITALHNEAIHAIRSVVLNRLLSLSEDFKKSAAIYEFLATKFRNAFAVGLGLEPDRFHCSIKLVDLKNGNVAERRVRTLARSEACTADPAVLRASLREETHQTVGMNSASAALLGCSDLHRNWGANYNCFCCNDLTKYANEYDNARSNYQDYYKAVMVFPLRWSERGKSQITVRGFLAFDSELTNVFPNTPCTFEYEHSAEAYYKDLCESVPFHVGGIIADVLATVIALHDERGCD
jgi:transcriptional regulator with XRE-family HTH domain